MKPYEKLLSLIIGIVIVGIIILVTGKVTAMQTAIFFGFMIAGAVTEVLQRIDRRLRVTRR